MWHMQRRCYSIYMCVSVFWWERSLSPHLAGRMPPVQSQLCQTHLPSTTNNRRLACTTCTSGCCLCPQVSHTRTHSPRLRDWLSVSHHQQLAPLLQQTVSQCRGVKGGRFWWSHRWRAPDYTYKETEAQTCDVHHLFVSRCWMNGRVNPSHTEPFWHGGPFCAQVWVRGLWFPPTVKTHWNS